MNIVFFGGSYCTDEYYDKVYKFCKKNFKNKKDKYKIITGATIGVMDAVSKAASEEVLHTSGVVLAKWKDYVNEYNSEVHYFDNELDRLVYMIKNGDIFICFDGDIGTLTELFPTWLYVSDTNKKLYLFGENIKDTIKYMYSNNYIKKESKEYINFVDIDTFELE